MPEGHKLRDNFILVRDKVVPTPRSSLCLFRSRDIHRFMEASLREKQMRLRFFGMRRDPEIVLLQASLKRLTGGFEISSLPY